MVSSFVTMSSVARGNSVSGILSGGLPGAMCSPMTTLIGGSGGGNNKLPMIPSLLASLLATRGIHRWSSSLHAPYAYARICVVVRMPPCSHSLALNKMRLLPKPSHSSSLSLGSSFKLNWPKKGRGTIASLSMNKGVIRTRPGSKSLSGGRSVETGGRSSTGRTRLLPGNGGTSLPPQSLRISHPLTT
jgi:hypothetical protein